MQAAVPAVRSCNPAAGVDFTAYQKFLYELIKGIYKGDKMSIWFDYFYTKPNVCFIFTCLNIAVN